MKIALANDHAGYKLKETIKKLLISLNEDVVDYGTNNENSCDLSDLVYPAAIAISNKECDKGIFIDGVGYGSALIANKIPHVFAAVAQDPFVASLASSHSNTNVLCLGGKIIGETIALEIVKTWLNTKYLVNEEKYTNRVKKIIEIDKKHSK